MTSVWAAKDPDDVDYRCVVWCDLLTGLNDGSADDHGDLKGATITGVTWTLPTGISEASHNQNAVTIDGVSYAANTVATIWFSATGTDQADYPCQCRITTSDNRTLDKTVILPVRQA